MAVATFALSLAMHLLQRSTPRFGTPLSLHLTPGLHTPPPSPPTATTEALKHRRAIRTMTSGRSIGRFRWGQELDPGMAIGIWHEDKGMPNLAFLYPV